MDTINLSLKELESCYPGEWGEVRLNLAPLLKAGRAEEINDAMVKAKHTLDEWQGLGRRGSKPPLLVRTAETHIIKAYITLLVIEKYLRTFLNQPSSAAAALQRRDGWIAQRLFFTPSCERRTLSRRWFNFWWRLIANKRAVMSLIQGMGIYTIYSKELVKALAHIIDKRPCLEVGAGDGTLSLLLEKSSVNVQAIDDYSWSHRIKYPGWVEKIEAKQALAKYQPKVVICSWPPPNNSFEKHIFASSSVDVYIVIGSRHRFASGNWQAYEEQSVFSWQPDEELTRYALPLELDNLVLVFRRVTAEKV